MKTQTLNNTNKESSSGDNSSEEILLRAVKLRLYPNAKQRELLAQMFGNSRFIYNYFLDLSIKRHEKGEKRLSAFDMNKEITLLKKRKEYEWLKLSSNESLRFSIRQLDTAFQNFFRRVKKGGAPGFPRFKSKNSGRETISLNQKARIEGNKISLEKFREGFKVRGPLDLLQGKNIRQATVSYEAGRYFVSCLVYWDKVETVDHPIPKVGIDRGVTIPFSCSYREDGELKDSNKGLRLKEKLEPMFKKLSRAQRVLSRRVKGSKNRAKAKLKVQRIWYKIRQVRKNFVETFSDLLTKTFRIIKFEELKVSNMARQVKKTEDGSPRTNVSQKRGLNRSILRDVGVWYSVVQRTKDKAFVRGGEVRFVKPHYTSQWCSSCGHIDSENRKSQSKFKCVRCGFTLNADNNASRNILAIA